MFSIEDIKTAISAAMVSAFADAQKHGVVIPDATLPAADKVQHLINSLVISDFNGGYFGWFDQEQIPEEFLTDFGSLLTTVKIPLLADPLTYHINVEVIESAAIALLFGVLIADVIQYHSNI